MIKVLYPHVESFCSHKETSELVCVVPGTQQLVPGMEVPLRLHPEARITAACGGMLVHS